MKNQLLIEEYSNNDEKILVEASSDENTKDLYLKGVFMQANIRNRNKRIYQLHEMCKVVEDANEQIKQQGGIFGEADHPTTLNINIDRISHVIQELYMDGNNVIGKAKILSTPIGNIVKTLLGTNVKLGVSSRGTGQVNEDGLVEGFGLITVDVVVTPSAMGATPSPVYESLMRQPKGEKILKLSEALQQDKSAQKFFTREIKSYLDSLLNKK